MERYMSKHKSRVQRIIKKDNFLERAERQKRRLEDKSCDIKYIYSNNDLECLINKSLKDITYKDIWSCGPYMAMAYSEKSLLEWLDLHKEDKHLLYQEYKEMNLVLKIIDLLDFYFDNSFAVPLDTIKQYGELTNEDKYILNKLKCRFLLIENNNEWLFKSSNATNHRVLKISIAREIYNLFCKDNFHEKMQKHIEDIKECIKDENFETSQKFVICFLIKYLHKKYKQEAENLGYIETKDGELPF